MFSALKVFINYEEFTVVKGTKVLGKNTEAPRRSSTSVNTNVQEIMSGKQGKREAFTRWYHSNINNLKE